MGMGVFPALMTHHAGPAWRWVAQAQGIEKDKNH